MRTIAQHELRNQISQVLRDVEGGESLRGFQGLPGIEVVHV